jgi:hypothetical protein
MVRITQKYLFLQGDRVLQWLNPKFKILNPKQGQILEEDS